MVLFLGPANWRSALVVALAVPVALLGAFLLLDWRGIPANLISMGAIDFGIIVDSSVVIVEDLLRILEERKGAIRSLPAAIIEAVTEMGRPVMFSKVILLTAFIPLYTLQRVEGRIFKPMALTLTFALAAGTVFAICRRARPGQLRRAKRGSVREVVDCPAVGAALPPGPEFALQTRRRWSMPPRCYCWQQAPSAFALGQ